MRFGFCQLLVISIVLGTGLTTLCQAQTTSWTGQFGTNWKVAGNWSNGVPDASKDAIIGDGSFLGISLPTIPAGAGSAICKSLTVGNTGTIVVLTISDDLTVNGTVTIGPNGTILQGSVNVVVTGDWLNNGGSYGATLLATPRVYFSGTSQSIGGTSNTAFVRGYVNAGSTVTLARNSSFSDFINISGTLDPTENFSLTGFGNVDINTNGVLKVKATTLAGNYPNVTINPATATSVVEYASTINAQTVNSALGYKKLTISGNTVKTAQNNLTIANDLAINSGTLDLSTFTANRSTSGGSFTIAGGATLRIGGATTTFPSNYTTRSFAPTSTVEYYGGAQTVTSESYGNLTLTSSSGAITKTMPGTSFSVAGNLTASASAGTLAFTAGNAINVSGNVSLNAATTFGAGTFSHSIGGNWVNAGTFNGCGSTVTFTGAGATMSGAGTNQFGNLAISGNGFTVNAATSLLVCGNFSTTGGGTFTHTTGGAGTLSMNTVSAKNISGSNITFDDLIVAAGSVATTATFTIAGDFTATGTLSATGGTITLSGTGKVFGGAGAVQVAGLSETGSLTTSRDISISGNFSVSGSYTATTSGLTTFNGTSAFSGTAQLVNVAIAASSALTMGGNSTLLISGTQTLGAGATLNTSANVPNTFNFNASGAQTIVYTTFNNLTVSNGGVKTSSAGITSGGTFTIGAGTTFNALTLTHSVAGNFVNNGTFTAGTSTVQLTGTTDTSITGATSFNNLTVNKTTANVVTMNSSINVVNMAMTAGKMLTGLNTLLITATRTGSGIIMGTITRTHAFTTGVNYAFEGPDNFINFSIATGVTSITVNVTNAAVTNFPSGLAINRRYAISVTATAYLATLRLHYEQNEINGNSEAAMQLYNDQGINTWFLRGKTANDVGNNWVELSAQASIVNVWTMSDGQNILSWNGSVSSAWENLSNWTVTAGSPSGVPTLNETVQIGDIAFTNPPVINSTAQAKGITFLSTKPGTLTIASGTLTVQGNIQGSWSSNATHTIDVGSRTLTTFSDMILSDGTAGHAINLTVTSGSVNVNGTLTQSGGANITYTGAGDLAISKDYIRASGTYSGSPSGTVTYNGTTDQAVATVTYQNLAISKSAGLATTTAPVTINGNLLVSAAGGQLNANGSLTVGGNVQVNSGATLNTPASDVTLGGDWNMNGSFIAGSGTVMFNGTGAQSMTATTFNNVTVNKTTGTLTLNGNINLNGNISILAGTVDVNTRDVTRTTSGGIATLGANATARFSGSGLQISNFSNLIAHPASTVEYYGTSARPIPPVTFGNLIISNGGANAKTMVAPTIVLGDLTVNTGATLTLPSTTLNVAGNIINNGTFNTSGGTLILDGASKTIANAGTVAYNNMVVNGSYTVTSGALDFNGHLQINGSLDLGSATVNSSGDLTNSGSLFSSGNVTFLGTQVQTIRLLNAVSSTSTGVINFNGTISPVLNSNSIPTFATVNINNTAPITPSEGWVVGVAMNIAAGSTWNAGPHTHTIAGSLTNNGTINSSGNIRFTPTANVSVNLGSNFSSTNKITLGGSGLITLSGSQSTFTSVDVTNTNAAGVTLPIGWTMGNLLINAGARLNGGAALTHNIGGTWTNNGLFNGGTSTVNFTSAGTDQIVGSGTSNFNNIVFTAGSKQTLVSEINVSGNWTNNAASLLIDFGKVHFTGSGTSSIDGTLLTNFHDIEVNKTGAGKVQLLRDALVGSSILLTAGPLDLNAHRLTITNPLNSAIVRTGGYILSESTTFDSKLDWLIGTDATMHEFAFGTSAGVYIPFQFTLTSGDIGTLSVSTYGTGANNLPLPPGVTELNTAGGVNNSPNTVDRFFFIDPIGAVTPVATVTFSASAAEVGTITNLMAQRWRNVFGWDPPLAGQTRTATSVTVPGITSFSPWAISGNNNALPIELSSINANLEGNKVVIRWETLSELNNDYFEVEKSENGKDFFAISKVRGSGTVAGKHNYYTNDYEIKKGRIFYRLKQVDFDKRSTYSGVVAVTVGELDPIEFHLTPNPVVEKLVVTSTSGFLDNISVTVFDAAGKVAHQSSHPGFGQDANLSVDMVNLSPGVYVVNIDYAGLTRSFRIFRK